MANTFVKIATVTVGSGGAANIDFSSIPQTYTDLNLVISGRGVYASSTLIGIQLGINGGFPTPQFRNLIGNSTTATSTNGTFGIYAGSMNAGLATANTFSNVSIYFPNYTSTSNKSYSSDSVTENNSSATDSVYTSLWAGTFTSTSGITGITIYDGTAGQNIAQYSTATLYGISKS